jgi:hypothetical protein
MKKVLFTLTVTLLLFACQKESITPKSSSSSDVQGNVIIQKEYCEATCPPTSNDGKPQKKCINVPGNCKKAMPCTDVTSVVFQTPPSLEQIEAIAHQFTNNIVLNDFINLEDYNSSFNHTYNYLVSFYYN